MSTIKQTTSTAGRRWRAELSGELNPPPWLIQIILDLLHQIFATQGKHYVLNNTRKVRYDDQLSSAVLFKLT